MGVPPTPMLFIPQPKLNEKPAMVRPINRAHPHARAIQLACPFATGGGTTVLDASGYGRNGTTVNSPSWRADPQTGLHLQFTSASSQAVTFPLIDSTKADMYIAAWVWFTTASARSEFIVVGDTNVGNGLQLQLKSTSVIDCIAGGFGGKAFDIPVTTLRWYHIVWTISAANYWRLYLDGVQVAADAGWPTTSPTGRIELGRYYFPASHAFFLNGRIADFRIGYYTPTAGEVWDMYSPQNRWALYQAPARTTAMIWVPATMPRGMQVTKHLRMPPKPMRVNRFGLFRRANYKLQRGVMRVRNTRPQRGFRAKTLKFGPPPVQSMNATAEAAGVYRVSDSSLVRYEIYKGVDAEPDLSPTAAPWETFTSLPHTTTGTLSAGDTHFVVVRKRNAYNLLSQNAESEIFELDGGGNQSAVRPSSPTEIELIPWAAGTVKATAQYRYDADGASQADAFLVFLTSNGVDPHPGVVVPTEVEMTKRDGVAKLSWISSAFTEGATIKVIVRTRRNGTPDVDSDNLDVHAATATLLGPAAPDTGAFVGEIAKQTQ